MPSAPASPLRIQIAIGANVATGTLDDTLIAREMTAMLPVTLQMRDLFGREQPGPLPTPLSTDDADCTYTYAVGDIA